MSYLVLARKLRPQTFAEIVGQRAVVRTLTNALESGRIHHAFLLCGPRGTGKTSIARILAKALCCDEGPTPTPCNVCNHCTEITAGTATDVLEIDGASNTGVDDVRQLRENARYLPVSSRRKIYIIDEVHMLSVSAFNALLKTLEEPPEHVTFVFATTEPHKIPVTILSRCQRYDLTRVSPDELVAMLAARLEPEGVHIERLGLEIIATNAEGSVRDALSLVDQAVSYCGSEAITGEMVRAALGLTDRQTLLRLSEALLAGDAEGALTLVERVYQSGQDLVALARSFLGHLRDLAVARSVRDPGGLVQASAGDLEQLCAQAAGVAPEVLLQIFDRFARAADEVARSETPKLVLEMALVGLARAEPLLPLGDLLVRLESLEARLTGGGGGGGAGGGGGGGARGGGSGRRPAAPSRPPAAVPDRRGSSRAQASPRAGGDPAEGGLPAEASAEEAPPRPAPSDEGTRSSEAAVAPPSRRGVALPADPLEAWGVVVELLERHSRRLAANLYRARLIRLADGPEGLVAVVGLATGSFEHQQLSGPGVVEELGTYLSRKLGRAAHLTVEAEDSGAGPVAGPSIPAPAPAPTSPPGGGGAGPGERPRAAEERRPSPEPTPRSLRERDEQWRREEAARKRQEALSHPAVKDATEILEGSIQEVRVLD